MKKRAIILLLICVTLLSGCVKFTIGSTLEYGVNNNDTTLSHYPEDERICLGGLKLKVMTQDTVMFESPIVTPAEEQLIERRDNPTGFYIGSPMKVEAWCYATDESLEGYFLFEGKVKGGKFAFGVDVVGHTKGNSTACLTPTSSTGVIPCVISKLF